MEKKLREHILYIDQAPYLFSGSIRDNITLGEDFPKELLNKLLKKLL